MNITDVETLPCEAAVRERVFVKVDTDQGIHGWGEAGGMGRERACDATVQELKHHFIGQVGSARPSTRMPPRSFCARFAPRRCPAAPSAHGPVLRSRECLHVQEGSTPCPTVTR